MRLRLLVDRPADGAANMAVDEALLDSALKPNAPATLRLYRFRSPSVTFGYAQPVAIAVDAAACRSRGVDCVRRITGGRALVHQHELTYSFSAPTQARSVKSVYQTVTGALRSALEQLRIPIDPLRMDSAPRSPAHLPCLAVATGHEITARGGDKLVASAMRFRRRGFLQHGSILWSVDHALWRQLTRLDSSTPLAAVGIRELEGPRPSPSEADLIDALCGSFSKLVGAPAVEGDLAPQEVELAAALEEKYRQPDWTEHRGRTESRLVDNSEAVW